MTELPIPASMAAAWGVPSKPARGPKPALSLDRIVAAAITAADADGLPAVSMQRVARELGSSPMALYRYVESKDELLALMVDGAYGPPPPAPTATTSWRAGMASWAEAELAAYRRHPWAVRVRISGPPIAPNSVAWFERALSHLSDTPLTPSERPSVVLLVSNYVRSQSLLEADFADAFRATGQTMEASIASYNAILLSLTDASRFPHLHDTIAAGVFDAADDPDEEFRFGLDRILDGVESLIKRRTKGEKPEKTKPGKKKKG